MQTADIITYQFSRRQFGVLLTQPLKPASNTLTMMEGYHSSLYFPPRPACNVGARPLSALQVAA